MAFTFRKATKKQRKLRLALAGPSGSGKTFSALSIGCNLGKKVALIDTEGSPDSGGSAELYADFFDFDCVVLPSYSPATYIDAIKAACEADYDVIIIDSLSHAWFGAEGALEQVNKEMARSGNRNSYTAWRNVTPLHNALIQTILHSNAHVICTMRAKEKYIMEEDDRGRSKPKKIGMEAIQRDGMGFEFDMFADMDIDHNMIISKTRIGLDGDVINKPGKALAKKLLDFLNSGVAAEPIPDQVPVEVEQSSDQVPEPSPKPKAKPKHSVSDLIKKIPVVMERFNAKNVVEAVDIAHLLVCAEFDVTDINSIPSEEADRLATYMNTTMLTTMRKDGFIS